MSKVLLKFLNYSGLLLALSLVSALNGAEVPLRSGQDWCSVEYSGNVKAAGKLKITVKPKLSPSKDLLFCHVHWKDKNGKYRGFLTAPACLPKPLVDTGVNFDITLPSKQELGYISLVIFASPNGSFKKKNKVAFSKYIPLDGVVKKEVKKSKSSAVTSISLQQKKKLLGMKISGDIAPGKDIVVTVHCYDVETPNKLMLHLHWKDRKGKSRGFLCGPQEHAQGVAPDKDIVFHVKLPNKPDLGAVSFLAFLSKTGSWSHLTFKAVGEYKLPLPKPKDCYIPPFSPNDNRTAAGQWKWQQSQAVISATGDLSWAPVPEPRTLGKVIRYIDYENGNDNNPGDTPKTPWKHHPWDPNATGKAKGDQSADTYVFKRGVIYRGSLTASRSGASKQPLLLCSSFDWGQGSKACLSGAEKIRQQWKKIDNGNIWYCDPGTDHLIQTVWQVVDGKTFPLHIARTPNWTFSNPDDMRAGWFTWKKKAQKHKLKKDGKTISYVVCSDPENLKNINPENSPDMTIWSEYYHLMGYPEQSRVISISPEEGTAAFAFPSYRALPVSDNRYYLENSLSFLDVPGEFYYDRKIGRLYLRLPEDRDPNTTTIEFGVRTRGIFIASQQNIVIRGLEFRRFNEGPQCTPPWRATNNASTCIQLEGNCHDITISHCKFKDVSFAVKGNASGQAKRGQVMDRITISDNDIENAVDGGINIGDGVSSPDDYSPYLFRVEIKRNRLRSIGLRSYSFGNGIRTTSARVGEISGNIIDKVGGCGIVVYAGKGGYMGPDGRNLRLARFIIRQNKVTNPLLLLNDYGGIETWQAGPTYVYGNISGNPGGFRNFYPAWVRYKKETDNYNSYTSTRFGFAYYLDGAFKNYHFNNIGWGKNNQLSDYRCNTGGLMQVHGFNNSFFNNTFYKFGCGSRQQFSVHHQSVNEDKMPSLTAFVGNLWIDVTDLFMDHDAWLPKPRDPIHAPIDFATMAFTRNFFYGSPNVFGKLEYRREVYKNIQEFQNGLQAKNALESDTGTVLKNDPLRDPAKHDFRLVAGSAPIDHGAKYFVPWGLFAVVGEWNFHQFSSNDKPVLADASMYLTDECRHRFMYRHVPRNDLTCVNISRKNFSKGTLENWIKSALVFDGSGYARIKDGDMKKDMQYIVKHKPFAYQGEKRETLDMGTNNFLIECVFKTAPDYTGGTLVSKLDSSGGYTLGIDKNGHLYLEIVAEAENCRLTSSLKINDGRWLHAIAEVDRSSPEKLRLYLNGKRDVQAVASGTCPAPDKSLSNSADFIVGKGPDCDAFKGAMDFLRVSRGTLRDAYTSIEELYAWEFNGPFLKDFTNSAATGKSRDAGALEFRN